MPTFPKNMILRLGCGLYRGLLLAYPPEFRARYGVEMNQVFRDQLRDTLSKRGLHSLASFSIRAALDLFTSVLRERFTMKSAIGMLCLCAAFGFSLLAEHVDRHNVTEVYPTLMVALVGSFILGLIQPAWPWRWAIIVGLGVPFFGPLPELFARLASPGRWAMLAVLLIPGLIGAYTGSFLRRAIGVSPSQTQMTKPD